MSLPDLEFRIGGNTSWRLARKETSAIPFRHEQDDVWVAAGVFNRLSTSIRTGSSPTTSIASHGTSVESSH